MEIHLAKNSQDKRKRTPLVLRREIASGSSAKHAIGKLAKRKSACFERPFTRWFKFANRAPTGGAMGQ